MAKSKKSKKTTKASIWKTEAKPVTTIRTQSRKLKTPEPKFPRSISSFRKNGKPPKVDHHPVPPAYKLLQTSVSILIRNWRLFLGLSAIYGFLNLLFVRGFSTAANVSTIKSDFSSTFHGHASNFGNGIAQYISLLGGSSNSALPSAGVYQSILIVLASLATIWCLRQLYSGVKPRIRDGYYKGVYPAIPVFLIMLVVGLELLPFVAAAGIFTIIVAGGIASTGSEKIITDILCLGLTSLTIYWLCSTIFALYIATLPDMTPMTALRSARNLVRYRRFIVFKKVIFLPFAFLLLTGIVMTPVVLFLTPIASWAFFILTIIGLPIVHSYMYATYRELL